MKLEFSIYRYNRMSMTRRTCRTTPQAEEGRDMMLLDALIQLKEKDRPCRSSLMPRRRVRFRWPEHER